MGDRKVASEYERYADGQARFFAALRMTTSLRSE
jgi:hypothetical protein